jgi:hypothetical protein
VSKDLYEKGEKTGELLQQKLYEYYGFYHTAGGRRTAGIVAARFLARYDFISTVYIASSEARSLIRTSEQGVSKYVLIKVPNSDMEELAKTAKMKESDFSSAYMIDRTPDYGVGIFQVKYAHNEYSTPPPDGKLRELNPEYHWLNVDLQLLIPPPTSGDARPLVYSRVYG